MQTRGRQWVLFMPRLKMPRMISELFAIGGCISSNPLLTLLRRKSIDKLDSPLHLADYYLNSYYYKKMLRRLQSCIVLMCSTPTLTSKMKLKLLSFSSTRTQDCKMR